MNHGMTFCGNPLELPVKELEEFINFKEFIELEFEVSQELKELKEFEEFKEFKLFDQF